ncbi:MAG: hypothetical protein ACHQQQ_05325 [Bacteroidota bacterium]
MKVLDAGASNIANIGSGKAPTPQSPPLTSVPPMKAAPNIGQSG